MKFSQRLGKAWSVLTGKRDTYIGVYGNGPKANGFAGGAVGRLQASLATWSASINSDLDGTLPIMRARGRALAANNEHGRRFLSLVGSNVIGRNNPQLQVRAYFAPQAKPGSKGAPAPTLDKAANDAIETAWMRWGKVADITGRHKNLSGFWRMVAKATARDGESLIRIVRDASLDYGMALQALEADRLDDAINTRLSNGNVIRHGVEIDTRGRAVAYHIRTIHPGENYVSGTPGVERVPASDVIHVFMPERAEQVRGVTWFHAVIIRGSTIHRFEDAAVTAAEIGASKVATLEADVNSGNGAGAGLGLADTTSDGTALGIPQITAEAGEILDLTQFPGVKLNSWNPDYPHANFESFLKACLRGLAAGLDVAAHNLTGDMTDVNYSSARIAELNEREIWMCLQDWFISSVVEPIYAQWLALALLRGDIVFEASGKALPPERLDKFLNASKFVGRRWSWVDPAKEMEANAAGVQLGVTSRTRIAAEQGVDIEDVFDELTQEREQMQAAGIPTDVKPGNAVQDAPANASNTAPPEPAKAGKQLDAVMKMADAMQKMANREQPAPVFNMPVEIRTGDTSVHLPDNLVQLDAHITTPEVRAGDVVVNVAPAPVTIAQPAESVEEYERDPVTQEITRTTRRITEH